MSPLVSLFWGLCEVFAEAFLQQALRYDVFSCHCFGMCLGIPVPVRQIAVVTVTGNWFFGCSGQAHRKNVYINEPLENLTFTGVRIHPPAKSNQLTFWFSDVTGAKSNC